MSESVHVHYENVQSRGKQRTTSRDLRFELIHTDAGRRGWRVHLGLERPLATPCVDGNSIWLGGGYGSYDFFCLDAGTGQLRWRLRTRDDGPTAAVLFGGHVAFNTESCTVYVCDAATGRVVWEKWLGDPLLSQPAIMDVDGRPLLFMVYPTRNRQHLLEAFELMTGKSKWSAQISADAISCPVAVDDSVYVATMDGTIYQFRAATGDLVLRDDAAAATSAPWVDGGELFYSKKRVESRRSRDESGKEYEEDVVHEYIEEASHAERAKQRRARHGRRAEWLRADAFHMLADVHAKLDMGVGFAVPPATAKLYAAGAHLGSYARSVAGAWSYQGARPVVADGRVYAVVGTRFTATDRVSGEIVWDREFGHELETDRQFGAPAYAGGKLYATSIDGRLLVLDGETGEVAWAVRFPEPILFQPAVMNGFVYVGTLGGALYCLDAQDDTAHGWPMWGGGPGHNSVATGRQVSTPPTGNPSADD